MAHRLQEKEGRPTFFLDEGLYLGQKDIRELQTAVASVAAACQIVLDYSGIRWDELDRVFLAGSFGTSLDPWSAGVVGLAPPVPVEIVEGVGNAAMAGAAAALASTSIREEAFRIPSRTEYLELSGHPRFNDAFIEAMAFPTLPLSGYSGTSWKRPGIKRS
jgi:uncharacterized 2Fe-2S/4Fe-4S cluster protein (DUF4445 family)